MMEICTLPYMVALVVQITVTKKNEPFGGRDHFELAKQLICAMNQVVGSIFNAQIKEFGMFAH